MGLLKHCITPDWPVPPNIKTLQTTRHGGISFAPYDTFNLGLHVGDDPQSVECNRQMLVPIMPSKPLWLDQVHGTVVVNADSANCLPQADACFARHRGAVCVVMTADCLPVLFCDEAGTVVGVAHVGWKGLVAGVIESTVISMDVAPKELMVWLGPAIGKGAFEVGEEVRTAFISQQAWATEAFIPYGDRGKYHADIYLLARQRLQALGISRIYGGNFCTYEQNDRFFSYRREGVTGRMGTFIWIN